MAAGTTAPACAEILQKTGRECAKLGQLGVKFKGDPDAYFAAATKAWGTDFQWNKEKGIVTVSVAEGECSCPLVDSKRTPAFFCNCSVGYQKEAFETDLREAGPGVAQGVETRWQQAVRVRGHAVARRRNSLRRTWQTVENAAQWIRQIRP